MADTQEDSLAVQWVEFTKDGERERVIELVKRYKDEWGGTREQTIAFSLEEAEHLAERLSQLIAAAKEGADH
jgi:hypothetical protein